MLEFDLRKEKLTKQKYRKHIIELIEATGKFPITNIDGAIQAQWLMFELSKELYRIDSEDGE